MSVKVNCVVCKKEFVAMNRAKKYCSATCKNIAAMKRYLSKKEKEEVKWQ